MDPKNGVEANKIVEGLARCFISATDDMITCAFDDPWHDVRAVMLRRVATRFTRLAESNATVYEGLAVRATEPPRQPTGIEPRPSEEECGPTNEYINPDGPPPTKYPKG